MREIDSAYISRVKDVIARVTSSYVEIRISSSKNNTIVLSDKHIDTVSTGTSIGGSIRIFHKGAWGFASFSRLDDIETIAEHALEFSKKLEQQTQTALLPAKKIVMHKKTEKKKDFATISFDEKFALISRYNDILRDSPKIQTTKAIYKDSDATLLYCNSEGSEIVYDRAHCGVSFSAIAKDGNEIQPFHDSIAGYAGYDFVEGREAQAEEVVKTAVDLLSAEPLEGGAYDVIVDPRLAGVFIHEAFGHLSEADFIFENERMSNLMVLGRVFGPPELHVIDDGNMEDQVGYIPADDEGVLPQKTALIKKGVLAGRLHSRETAAKMDEPLTGNARAISVTVQPIIRMTNTYIDNGPYAKKDLFDSMEDGVYAVNYHGGQTNLEMFTFSSAYGYKIKNGKKQKMYKNIVLSGNVFETLKNISMIANDMQMYGGLGGCGKGGQFPLPVSFGGPHMLIKNVLIGGVQ
jgi:TldD protein